MDSNESSFSSYDTDIDSDSSDNYDGSSGSSSSNSASESDYDSSAGTSSSESEGDQTEPSEVEKLSEPLFENAELTLYDSRMLVLHYALKHGLTQAAFQDLLHLLNSHLPEHVNCFTSIYKLKKFFTTIHPSVVAVSKFYCSFCQKLLPSKDDTCNGLHCSSAKVAEFSYVPLTAQLLAKFSG